MKVLIIDDEEVNTEILTQYLYEENYEVVTATNGLMGLAVLTDNPDISVILLDRIMPVMGGLDFIREMRKKEEFLSIPVIIQTAVTDGASIAEGINAGAYYYLTKPYNKILLISIIDAAINDAKYKNLIIEEVRKNRKMLGLVNTASFELRTMEEAHNLALFIAGSFPDPEKVVLGLSEIIINSVEHGTLQIGYHEKGKLMMAGKLSQEILRREELPENKIKRVQVTFEKNAQEAKVTITDQGHGFDWTQFMEMNPTRASDPNGRGIIMSRKMSFDEIEYIGRGNKVCCKVRLTSS